VQCDSTIASISLPTNKLAVAAKWSLAAPPKPGEPSPLLVVHKPICAFAAISGAAAVEQLSVHNATALSLSISCPEHLLIFEVTPSLADSSL